MKRLVTLLVTPLDGKRTWMGGDAAISGVGTEIRDRQYQLKIVRRQTVERCRALRAMRTLAPRSFNRRRDYQAGETVTFLLESHHENPSIDLAIDTWMTPGYTPCGFLGAARELPTFHVGNTDPFEHLQRIRHDAKNPPIPGAVSNFFSRSRDTDPVS